MVSFDYNYQKPSLFLFRMLIRAVVPPLGLHSLNNKEKWKENFLVVLVKWHWCANLLLLIWPSRDKGGPHLLWNLGGGHWGKLETAKLKKKTSKTAKPLKNSPKTENHIQNHQKPIKWWQVGHTEQTTLTLILSKYLWMSWTCLKPSYLLVSFSFYRLLSSLFTLHLNVFFFRKFSPPFPSS